MSADKWEAMARALAKALRDDMTGPDQAETRVSAPTRDALEAIEKCDGLDMDALDVAIEKLTDEYANVTALARSAGRAALDAEDAAREAKDALDDVRRKRGLIR